MYKIVKKETLGPDLHLYEIEVPRIARSRQCGQFVMVRAFDHSERLPLTVAQTNPEAGTISLIVQTVGKSTLEMSSLQAGQFFQDVAGPMGQPSHLGYYGTVVVIGGGLGTAVVYPQAIALRELGNKIISIIGARSEKLLILKEQLAAVSDQLIMITDDGSSGKKGFVTDALQELLDAPETDVDAVYTAGPVVMMKAVSEVTRAGAIPTQVSLNPIMVDGTGMCGGCRVSVGGVPKFACVDGPEFDGHQVNFDELMDRLTTYKSHEARSLDDFKRHACKLQ
ncbi:MAG: sulfide/dihydroorotate dehydrogenase-like FAD/NAD-binding protein [Phycisphaerae bacterium]|nr:sulfide/dihydroorotate dehydrogenase-like FAD/NAD-binding protein [Phycisphaerae bacterium]